MLYVRALVRLYLLPFFPSSPLHSFYTCLSYSLPPIPCEGVHSFASHKAHRAVPSFLGIVFSNPLVQYEVVVRSISTWGTRCLRTAACFVKCFWPEWIRSTDSVVDAAFGTSKHRYFSNPFGSDASVYVVLFVVVDLSYLNSNRNGSCRDHIVNFQRV